MGWLDEKDFPYHCRMMVIVVRSYLRPHFQALPDRRQKSSIRPGEDAVKQTQSYGIQRPAGDDRYTLTH